MAHGGIPGSLKVAPSSIFVFEGFGVEVVSIQPVSFVCNSHPRQGRFAVLSTDVLVQVTAMVSLARVVGWLLVLVAARGQVATMVQLRVLSFLAPLVRAHGRSRVTFGTWTCCCGQRKTQMSDWDSFSQGVREGPTVRMPRLPALYRPKKKWRLAAQADPLNLPGRGTWWWPTTTTWKQEESTSASRCSFSSSSAPRVGAPVLEQDGWRLDTDLGGVRTAAQHPPPGHLTATCRKVHKEGQSGG